MRSIILYGAYDRYNYGDNLMPIVFHRFLEKYYPEILENHIVEYASLFESDLTKYGCIPTVPISDAIKRAEPGSKIVVVGGETLDVRAMTLFCFTVKNPNTSKAIKTFSRFGGKTASFIGTFLCGTGFEFPLTPSPSLFSKDLSVCFSAIGGNIPKSGWSRNIILERLDKASYLSFRDSRNSFLKEIINPKVNIAPDSVSALPDLFNDDFIDSKISKSIRHFAGKDYFVFQASPYKCKESAKKVAQHLKAASKQSGINFVLLPIGYASGHDDRQFLREIAHHSSIPILESLNVWEILYVLKHGQAYFGSSLHGAITAMAYSKPHFAIGTVPKLKAYLQEWSVNPFLGLHDVADIPTLVQRLGDDLGPSLEQVSSTTVEGALNSLHNIVRSWDE